MTNRDKQDISVVNLEKKIVNALDKIVLALKNSLWERGMKVHLSPTQIQVLLFLHYHQRDAYRTVSYMSREFGLTKGTMSEVIKTLEKKKLIKKINDKTDGRKFYIYLTVKGKAIVDELLSSTKILYSFLNEMKEDSKVNLFNELLDIVIYLHKSGMINLQRMCFNCKYYREKYYNNQHYCLLMNIPLHSSDIQIDCPEHQDIIVV